MVFMAMLLLRPLSLRSGHYGISPFSSAPSPSRSLTMSLLRRRGCFSDKMKSRRRVTLDRVDTHPPIRRRFKTFTRSCFCSYAPFKNADMPWNFSAVFSTSVNWGLHLQFLFNQRTHFMSSPEPRKRAKKDIYPPTVGARGFSFRHRLRWSVCRRLT